MGDFDRNASPDKKNESKKLVMVAALGAVLLGLIWFEFMKKSPEAMAGQVAPAAAAASDAAAQSPDMLMAELKVDPTAGLLIREGTPAQDSRPPRNPFHMADGWRASLVRPAEPGPVVHNDTPHPKPAAPAAPLPLSSENFKLTGIMHAGSSLYAIINNKILTVGNIVGKARVVEIREDGVSLQQVDSPDGPILQLSVQPSAGM